MKKIYTALSVFVLAGFGFGFFANTPNEQNIVTANPVHSQAPSADNATTTPNSHVIEGSFSRAVAHKEKRANTKCGVERKDNYSNIVVPLSKQHGLDWRLVTAIMAAESSFNPCAVSPAGAMGLMQIMPAVAEDFKVDLDEAFQPDQNIKAGVLLLKRLKKKYKGDLKLTVAAYNAGPGNVARYKGIPPFKETQNYVKKVLGYHSDLKMARATPQAGSPMQFLKAR